MRSLRVIICALVAVALVAAIASAKITEIGVTTGQSPSCPHTACVAVAQTTAFQVKVGTKRSVDAIPRDGYLIAWSITLGSPNKSKQTAYFNKNLGGPPEARITVLKPGKKLMYTPEGEGNLQALTPYLGHTVQFPLAKPIPVKKGWIVALTVPTWAPALDNLEKNATSWRASQAKGTCGSNASFTQTSLTASSGVTQFYCLYLSQRLTYSATLISTPGTPTVTTPQAPPNSSTTKTTTTAPVTTTTTPQTTATTTPKKTRSVIVVGG